MKRAANRPKDQKAIRLIERRLQDGPTTVPDVAARASVQPHRGWGELVEIMALPEDGTVLSFRQSLEHAEKADGARCLDPSKPHVSEPLEHRVAAELAKRIEELDLTWPSRPPALGRAIHSLSLEYNDIELNVRWHSDHRTQGPPGFHAMHEWLFEVVPTG